MCTSKLHTRSVMGKKSDQAKRIIASGVFRDTIESIPWVNGFRAGIHRVLLPFDDDAQSHKILTHKFLTHIMVCSSRTDLFRYSGGASGFVNQLCESACAVSRVSVNQSVLRQRLTDQHNAAYSSETHRATIGTHSSILSSIGTVHLQEW